MFRVDFAVLLVATDQPPLLPALLPKVGKRVRHTQDAELHHSPRHGLRIHF